MRVIKFRAWNGSKYEVGLTVTSDRNFNELYENTVFEQYTGLKDIGGVEIYEGDILNDDGHEYVVRWSNEDACFILDGQGVTLDFIGQDSEWYEIIGNVHEDE